MFDPTIRLRAYVENEDTPEDALDRLGNVPPWALGLGGCAKARGQSRVFSRESPPNVRTRQRSP